MHTSHNLSTTHTHTGAHRSLLCPCLAPSPGACFLPSSSSPSPSDHRTSSSYHHSIMLRRMLSQQRQHQLHLLSAASQESKRQSNVLLCCLTVMALSTTTTTPPQQEQSSSSGDPSSSSTTSSSSNNYNATADFAAHGRKLNVRVSPWLSSLMDAEGKDKDKDASSARRRRSSSVTWRSSPYVIVGMGVTGTAALQALLECKPDAEVTVVEAGTIPADFPHKMPTTPAKQQQKSSSSLSNLLLRGGGEKSSKPRVNYLWGTAVQSMDADAKILTLSDGSKLEFGKCLLAMGEGPVRVPSRFVDGQVTGRITPLYGAEDRRALGRLVAQGHHVTIVGSNWQSVELASYLSDVARRHGWGSTSVTLIFPESTPLAKELPRYLSGLLLRRLERRGVEVIPHTAIKYVGRAMDYEVKALHGGASTQNDSDTPPSPSFDPVRVYLTSKFPSLDSTALLTDMVVVGGSSAQGRMPMLEFEGHGLEVDARTGGIVVSHELMASSSVFVAGDAAFFPCGELGKRLTVRSADHAYHSGWVAGMNMAGREVRYQNLPLFFGTIPRLGVRAAWIGVCDGSVETHGFWWKNGSSGGSSSSNSTSGGGLARKRTRSDAAEEAQASAAAAAAAREGEGEGGLAGRVKGAFQKIVGAGRGRDKKHDNTSSAVAAMNIGTTGSQDSKSGRKLGIYRRTTTDRELGDLDAIIEAEMEQEALNGGAGVGGIGSGNGKSFTPVNGAGLVFFMDSEGIVRGILAWGLPVPAGTEGNNSTNDDEEDEEASQQQQQQQRIGGLAAVDPVLGGVIERARLAVADGIRSGTALKYDMNSRQDTLAVLRGLALDILGPEAVEQLGAKPPLYTYTSAKTLSSATDDRLFRINNNSRSSADMLEEAYEAAVRGHMQPVPGTNSVPFPFNRS